jgi:hypothetical protein
MICEVEENSVTLSHVTASDILSFILVWLGRNKKVLVFEDPESQKRPTGDCHMVRSGGETSAGG